MEVMHSRCIGIDVHQAVLVACLLDGSPHRKVKKETRKFRTVPAGIRELVEWVLASRCTLVAMESTGVYWLPAFEALEGKVDLLVANAEHMHNVPGRKTDIGDAEWIAELARHGLLRASFVPAREFRQLRDLTRYRRRQVETRATMQNRQIKYLEQCGVKLATFVTEMTGVSGRLMVQALADGKLSAEQMASLAKGSLRKKSSDLQLALDVELTEQQRFLLGAHYRQIQHFDASIEETDRRISQLCVPYAAELELLQTIPGIGPVAAPAVVSEIGTEVSRFASQSSFCSWVGVCPGNNESAGKRKHGRTRNGNLFLKTLLVECSWAAIKSSGYLRDKYYRLKARRGAKRAIMAIAHKLAIAIYQVLRRREPFKELGADYLDKRRGKAVSKTLIRRLSALGYSVVPAEPPAACTTPPAAPSPAKKPVVRRYVLKSSASTASAPSADCTPSNRAVPDRRAKRMPRSN